MCQASESMLEANVLSVSCELWPSYWHIPHLVMTFYTCLTMVFVATISTYSFLLDIMFYELLCLGFWENEFRDGDLFYCYWVKKGRDSHTDENNAMRKPLLPFWCGLLYLLSVILALFCMRDRSGGDGSEQILLLSAWCWWSWNWVAPSVGSLSPKATKWD